MKLVTVASLALMLVFASLAGTMPAAAADGFHAAYFSESSFLTLAPGQTGQFSVGFSNTGTEAWVKGVAGKQASLHTAAPLDNPVDSTAGWALSWTSPNIYAVQANDLVAPGTIGFFVYSVKVPTNAPLGAHNFYGRPSIDGVGFMEDYGYFQIATVTGGITITNATPPSPSANAKPTLNGAGAAAAETVSVSDGAGGAVVGTAVADTAGAWTSALTVALSSGTHSLVASTTSKGSSAPFTYVVNAASGPVVLNAYATATNTVIVTFNKAMKCASTSGRNDMTNPTNYFLNLEPAGTLGPTISTATASTDCTTATLTLSTALSYPGKNYTAIVYFVQDGSSTGIATGSNTTTLDTYQANVTSWSANTDGTLTVEFSKSMSTNSGSTGGQSVLNPSNYTLDSTTAASTTTITCLVSALNGCKTVRLQFAGGSGATVLGASGSVHTASVTNVIDAISAGQLLTPNPSSRQFTTAP